MNPVQARQSLKNFLVSRTTLKSDIIRKNAREGLSQLYLAQNRGEQNITEQEIEHFISQHFLELQQDADRVLREMCHKILPEQQWKYMLRQFGFLSVFLIPPLYPLCAYTGKMWAIFRADFSNLTALAEMASGVVGCILLLDVLFCSARTSFLKK